jgi:ribosomal protein S18 acetylase RimI-like enzyme
MTAIGYRNAGPGDGPEIAALFNRCFCETFGHLYRPEDLDAFLAGSTPEAWRDEIGEAGVEVRVAETGGTAAGFAKLGPLTLPADEPPPGSLELRSLYVLAPWQGGGIAQTLMDWTVARAKERRAPALYLSVFVENHRARRFYARYGFEYVGPYAFMVGDHADEDLILCLPLRDAG